MLVRILDIIISVLIIAYIFWKHRTNVDWYFLAIVLSVLKIGFDIILILRPDYVQVSVTFLNLYSRVIHWLAQAAVIYYSLKGEHKWTGKSY